jgi:hypothetical protein
MGLKYLRELPVVDCSFLGAEKVFKPLYRKQGEEKISNTNKEQQTTGCGSQLNK